MMKYCYVIPSIVLFPNIFVISDLTLKLLKNTIMHVTYRLESVERENKQSADILLRAKNYAVMSNGIYYPIRALYVKLINILT